MTACFMQVFPLTVSVTGQGTVSPSGGTYDIGTEVSLVPTPDTANGYIFHHWEGALTGTANPGKVTMDAAKSVTAVFMRAYDLTTQVLQGEYNGDTGLVENAAGASACGTIQVTPPGTKHVEGSLVTLLAQPNPGYYFDRWEGDVTGANALMTLTMNANKTVRAVFVRGESVLLSVFGEGQIVDTATNQPVTTGTYRPGTTFNVTAVPATGWTFQCWDDLEKDTTPTKSFTLRQEPEAFVAEFVQRPGVADLDLVADLAYTLQAFGLTESVDTYDYNKLTGITVDETTDAETNVYGPNGIPDAAELTVLERVLKTLTLDLSARSGITNDIAWSAWTHNLAQAQTELPANTDMRIVRVLAAYMTLGDYGSSRAIASTMRTAIPTATVDPNNYHKGQQRFLAVDSDANNDGTSNREGWDAALADGVQNSLTAAQIRDAYATTALAGPQYGESAKGNASSSSATSAKPNKVKPLQLFAQSIRDARQQWNRAVLRNLPPLLRNLFTDRDARKNPLIRALNAFIDAQRRAATGGDAAIRPQRGAKTTPSQCPNGSCIQAAVATAMPNFPASLGGMTVDPDNTPVLLGTKIGVSETPGAGHNFFTWNAPGTMLDGARECKPFRIMDNSLNIWAGMAGRYMSVRKSSSSGGVSISVSCGGGAIRAVDVDGSPLEDEYGNEMYLGPDGAYLTLTAQSQRPDYEVIGWQVGTGAPWLNLSGNYGRIVRSGMHGYASPVEQLKKSPAEKTKTAPLKAVAGNGGSVYGNFSSAWKGEFLGKVKVPVGTSGYVGAVANPGYRFVGWSDGSTETSRYATLGENGASYKAIFEPVAEYTLEIDDNQLVPDPEQEGSGGSSGQGGDALCMGYVSVESTDESSPPNRKRYYGADEVIALEAHVNSGYKFVHWIGDGTDINGVPLEQITSPVIVIRMGDITPSAAKSAKDGNGGVFPFGCSRSVSPAVAKIPLHFVTQEGDPVTNPKTSGSGQNKFVYSSGIPAVLTIRLEAAPAPCTPAEALQYTFSIDSIGCSSLTWASDNPGGRAKLEGGLLVATATFTNLPQGNSDFGNKTVTVSGPMGTGTGHLQVFFPETGPNPYELSQETCLGSSRVPRPVPNWYYYWKQTPASVGPFGFSYLSYKDEIWCGQWVFFEDPAGNDHSFSCTYVDDYTVEPICLQYSGIDTFAFHERHEQKHMESYNEWGYYADRMWTGYMVRCIEVSSPGDGDWLPDLLEDPQDYLSPFRDTTKDSNSDGMPDHQTWTMHFQEQWDLQDQESIRPYDWAAPGKQW